MTTSSLRRSVTLYLDALDERCVPATTRFAQTNLVSDQAGVAAITDANLVNPWGVAINPTGAFWVSDNQTGVTTLYQGDVNGNPLAVVSALPEVIGLGAPTGQVYNPTSDFVVHAPTGESGPAAFVFVSEDGSITAWNPGVPAPAPSTKAQIVVPSSSAVYKGVALAHNTAGGSAGNFLYAADFHGGHVNVFTGTFQPTVLDGTFTDPNLPAGYAPFNVQALGGKLYVTYAVQDVAAHDDVAGAGHGIVDVFDTAGRFLQRLVTGGELNSPWGLALAPSGFGAFGGDLLVGNFGDGRINAYDPSSGAFKGTLQSASGAPLVIDGLWALTFGNGSTAGDANKLYFTAGPNDEQHGLFGSLKPAQPSVLVGAQQFAVGADAGGAPVVKSFNADQSAALAATTVFDSSFTGGVRVAAGDFNLDGVADVAVGTGPGSATHVTLLDGKTGATLATVDPFEASFTGGVFVAVGDLNGDGQADLVITPDEGGGPRVRVFHYNLPVDVGEQGGLGQDADFLGIDDPNFRGGARAAVGDINGDGVGDLIVAAGFGGGPRVAAFSGTSLGTTPVKLFGDFLAFEPGLRNGAFVAVGDTNGDGKADVVAGGGPGGGPRVTVFDGAALLTNTQTQLANFFAGDTSNRGGVRVAVKNLDNDDKADLVVGSGTGAGSRVTAYAATALASAAPAELFHTDEFPGFSGGVFVG